MSSLITDPALEVFEAFAVGLATTAANVILPLFRAEHGLQNKDQAEGGFDPVTAADRDAEAAIRQAIAARYPDHGVIGEEYGEDRPDSEFVWVLDPIDGTRSFIAGLPMWTTLIALRHQGRPVVGLIAQPYLGEIFVGTRAGSKLLRGDRRIPLGVRACSALASATLVTTDPALFVGPGQASWTALARASRLVRYSADAYAYAMVAMGQIDVVVETGLHAWDIEAAVPLIEGAGGLVCDWRGNPVGHDGGEVLIAGDRACGDQALALLRR